MQTARLYNSRDGLFDLPTAEAVGDAALVDLLEVRPAAFNVLRLTITNAGSAALVDLSVSIQSHADAPAVRLNAGDPVSGVDGIIAATPGLATLAAGESGELVLYVAGAHAVTVAARAADGGTSLMIRGRAVRD